MSKRRTLSGVSTTVIELRQVIHAEREVPHGETDGRAATQEPTKRGRGRLGPRAGIPKRQRPNCPLVNEKRYSQFSVGGMSPQRRGGPKTPVCEGEGTQGTWRRGATGCCRLLRQLLVRHGWTVARVGPFVTLVALLDKPVEDFSIRSFGSASIQWTMPFHFSYPLILVLVCSLAEVTPSAPCRQSLPFSRLRLLSPSCLKSKTDLLAQNAWEVWNWATSSLRNHFRLHRWQQRDRAGFRLQDVLDEKVAH